MVEISGRIRPGKCNFDPIHSPCWLFILRGKNS